MKLQESVVSQNNLIEEDRDTRRNAVNRTAYRLMLALALLFVPCLHAGAIRIEPPSLTKTNGPIFVSIAIEGLGAQSLGAWDLQLAFNPGVISFNSVVFGDPTLGDQLDLSIPPFGSIQGSDSSVPGLVRLFELSLESPSVLNSLQADAFVLATLTFDAVGVGLTPITFDMFLLSDADGNQLVASASGAVVDVVPEPSASTLIGSGLFALALVSTGIRVRKSRRMCSAAGRLSWEGLPRGVKS